MYMSRMLVGSKIFCFYAGGSMATVLFLGVQTWVGSHIDSYPINWDFCNSYTYIFFLAHLTQRDFCNSYTYIFFLAHLTQRVM